MNSKQLAQTCKRNLICYFNIINEFSVVSVAEQKARLVNSLMANDFEISQLGNFGSDPKVRIVRRENTNVRTFRG